MKTESGPPRVSVVIPAYRVSPYLGEAVESALAQSWKNLEVLVVDQDHDAAIDAALAPYTGRIRRLYLSPPNVSAARNLAIMQASGDYIATLDGDDIWLPDAVETLFHCLESSPGADIVFGNAKFFGDTPDAGCLFQEIFPSRRPITYEDVASRRSAVFTGVLGTKKCFLESDLYDPRFRYGEDFDLWLRMLHAGFHFDFTEQVVCLYRRRADAACAQPAADRCSRLMQVYDRHLALPGLTQIERQALLQYRATLAFDLALARAKVATRAGEYGKARRLFSEVATLGHSPRFTAVAAAMRVAPGIVGPLLRWRLSA